MKLTSAQCETYRNDGVIPLGQILSTAEVEEARQHLAALMQKGLAVDAHAGTAVRMFRLSYPTRHDPWFWNLVRHPAVLDAAESVLGPNLQYFQDQVFHKPAGDGGRTSWHQDNYWWHATPPNMLTLWIALDQADPENGAVEYVAGSQHSMIEGTEVHVEKVTGYSSKTIADSAIDRSRLKSWTVPAGHSVMHHCQVIHGAGPNSSPRDRRGYTVHLQQAGLLKHDPKQFPLLRGQMPG